MLKEPFFREFTGVGEVVDCEVTDVVDRFVELFDLGGRERVGVLFRVDARIV